MLAFSTRQRDTGSISGIAFAAEPAQTLKSRWERLVFRRRQGARAMQPCMPCKHAEHCCSHHSHDTPASPLVFRPSHGDFDPLLPALLTRNSLALDAPSSRHWHEH